MLIDNHKQSKTPWLTPSGWTLALTIATLAYFAFGYQSLLFPLVFLVCGSLLSKIPPKNKKDEVRSAKQVFANGGVALLVTILYIINPNELFFILYLSNFSIALADTTSSEIGRRYGGKTIDIVTFKEVKKGLSGGISMIGTVSALIACALIASLYWVIYKDFSMYNLLIFAGFAGMLIDSLLGSTIQAKYKENGKILEEGNRANLIKGYPKIDAVNFLSISIITLLVAIILLLN